MLIDSQSIVLFGSPFLHILRTPLSRFAAKPVPAHKRASQPADLLGDPQQVTSAASRDVDMARGGGDFAESNRPSPTSLSTPEEATPRRPRRRRRRRPDTSSPPPRAMFPDTVAAAGGATSPPARESETSDPCKSRGTSVGLRIRRRRRLRLPLKFAQASSTLPSTAAQDMSACGSILPP